MQLIFLLTLFPIIHVLSIREDLTPQSWKRLHVAKERHTLSTAHKRYNCTYVIKDMENAGFNVTDCTNFHGDIWYRIDDLLSWEQAWNACTLIGGSDLASIHNVDDFNLLRHLFWMPDQDHTANWIGMNDIVEENRWTWTDRSQSDYFKWLAPMKEPNGGTEENCVMYQSQVAGGGCCWADGLLDFRCSHELPAICKLRNPRV